MRLNPTRKVFLPILFLFLLASLFLNIFLYLQLRKYYTLLYVVELDPLGLSYFRESTNSPESADTSRTVVLFGDSRAAQWPSPPIKGFQIINRGIGNQTSAQVVGRFDEHIKPLNPDIIVIQLCINDLKTIPLFPERKGQIIQDCKANLQDIVQASLEQHSIVVLSTIFPIGKIPLERRLVWSDEIEASRREVNDFIRSLAADRVIVFDTERLLSDDKGKMKQDYSFDTLHLNEAGYQALNLELIQILETIKQKQ